MNAKVGTGETAYIHWEEAGENRSARWRSEAKAPPPQRVVIADDTITADTAYRLANAGTAMLWRGDFQNARQLLQAMARRIDRKPKKKGVAPTLTPADAFHRHRMAQAQRARLLGMLLLPFDADYTVPLRRAPDVRQACLEAYGPGSEAFVVSLRELLGLIGAHEWRKNGVAIAALGERIHPHYGIFSPVRGEYLQLIAEAPLPSTQLAFDIGTGTGVIAALLAKRGIQRIIATDQDPRAIACAQENLARLGLQSKIELMQQDMFPPGRAPLVVCNPPWIPARANAPIEHAIYDPESRMLRAFLRGLAEHLEPGGEGWLILSDLAEHLSLRTRAELLQWIADGGLKLIERHDIRPHHPKAGDPDDPLHAARSAEVTSLWRLGSASGH
ncbi:MAG: class I SAM-dependent methyltransferase [Rhodocyclaceae bacterium]|nr:class I SAM-dependent methyltransferase [Rhodocyclaceae bacterium]MDZ4215070.1 class I SAM-dependent methyltransferase [Rhodocyclaceae bacterium]